MSCDCCVALLRGVMQFVIVVFLDHTHLLFLINKLKKFIGTNIFSAQFIKIISHFKNIGTYLLEKDCMLGDHPNQGCNLAFLFYLFLHDSQLYVLLSLYLLFVSSLYLDLYVLRNNSWII